MKRKVISVMLVSAMAATLLAGCGSSSSGDSTTEGSAAAETESSGDSGDKTTLTITFRDEGDGADGSLYKWFMEAYETYPNKDSVELDIQYITASEGDYFAKVELALADESTAPDIVCEDTFYLPSDVAAGYLTNLDDYIAEWDDWDNFYENTKDAAAYDGSVYGIPYSGDTRALLYNRSVLEEAGVIAEGEDWAPSTWQDILDACELIKTNTDSLPFWCNGGTVSGEATSMQTYEMIYYGTGEQLYEDDNWIVSSDAILDSLTFIQTLYDEGYASTDYIFDSEASNNVVDNYFPTGDIAIILNGVWVLSDYKDNGATPWDNYGEEIGVAAMPTQYGDGDEYVTMSGGWTLAIPELSDEKDAAWDFIEWCMNYDNYLISVEYTGNLSTRSDVAEDPAYCEEPLIAEFTDLMQYAYYRPHTDEYSTVTTYIQTMVEAVSSGTDPQDAMDDFKTSVINALDTTYGTSNYVEK
ncbi:MAG: extracellular solute-binding protein [Clostridiales bacterium]|nr:extracellular solute-binding protein [Clostridiales bacterium]